MTIIDELERSTDESFQRAMHRTLTNTEDYTRRIHWWIRLFGVVWIVSLIVSVLFGIGFGIYVSAASATHAVSDYSHCLDIGGSYSSCQQFLN